MASIEQRSRPDARDWLSYPYPEWAPEAAVVLDKYLQTDGALVEENQHRHASLLAKLLKQYGQEECCKFLDLCGRDLKLGLFVFFNNHDCSETRRLPDFAMKNAQMVLENIIFMKRSAWPASDRIIINIDDMLNAWPDGVKRLMRAQIIDNLAQDISFASKS